jgi:hypothetical protein
VIREWVVWVGQKATLVKILAFPNAWMTNNTLKNLEWRLFSNVMVSPV